VLVFGAVLTTGYRFAAVSQERADAIAETDRLDPGWRFEDLEAQRRLPPAAQNAALQVLKVNSLMPPGWYSRPARSPGEDPGVVDDVLRDLPPELQIDEGQARRLREDLARARPALAEARKLAGVPEGRYPIAWAADVLSTPCPWSDAIHAVRRLLRLDALQHDQDGDPDAALKSTRALLNLGRSLGEEPFWHGSLTRTGCRHEAVRAVERTLAQGQPSGPALAAMQEGLAREDAVPLLLPYFRGDRALLHIFLTRVDEGRNRLSELGCVPTRGLSAHAETWLGRPAAVHKHAEFLRGMNEAVEIARRPLEQQHPLCREWRRRRGYGENVGDGLMLGYGGEDSFLRAHASLRCAVIGLAAERYRQERGDWPRALADFVPGYLPAVPPDQFDGKSLRYRRTEGGAVVYSVGMDGHDDGGDPNPPPGEYRPRDMVFTLWDVARRRQLPTPPAPPTPHRMNTMDNLLK
jgi:hypothetical protein